MVYSHITESLDATNDAMSRFLSLHTIALDCRINCAKVIKKLQICEKARGRELIDRHFGTSPGKKRQFEQRHYMRDSRFLFEDVQNQQCL
jgi:hypothetical protein